jgi:DNA-binding response OmpR family regulator
LLQTVLEDARFEIDVAADGLTALSLAERATPDVAILDVMMPGMDGYELCRTLRARPGFESVRIVMLTAKNTTVDREEAVRAGADAFFTKPFSPLELIQAVNAALDGAA